MVWTLPRTVSLKPSAAATREDRGMPSRAGPAQTDVHDPVPTRRLAALAALGAASAVAPYAARAIGLEVDVPARVEVVDHVVPGLVAIVSCAVAIGTGARRSSTLTVLVVASVCLLAGLWVTTTHVPLLLDAAEGLVSWSAAVLHSVPGPPLVGLSLWLLADSLRLPPGAESDTSPSAPST